MITSSKIQIQTDKIYEKLLATYMYQMYVCINNVCTTFTYKHLASAVFCRYEQTFFQVHVQGNPGYFRYIIVKKY